MPLAILEQKLKEFPEEVLVNTDILAELCQVQFKQQKASIKCFSCVHAISHFISYNNLRLLISSLKKQRLIKFL